ncbi:DNA ligase (ATP) [Arcobacter nitrofigilis DSM 7299]|uniref:DNA ligase (ATP) n=1 Tax=Arcobacter nitrofigilis (strain ATCC 33309 / DSM 7299 / CCUG 15893 / LMG 7604 / NCTC 12251 / CI) TaxID=572480 RepID=D5V319_ARCNC|nr:DNA ligase [Arcobacter nitrofigilis]ADG92601.1 DNA ligase (ATP) [Arcobacter nitrofigilis DSM 7299]
MKIILILLFIVSNIFCLNLEKPKIYKNQDIKNWLMSEKLDGIRAYWDGKFLYTKNGNKIFVPSSFTHNFPPFELDGELWSKRDDFENIQSIVLDKTPSSKWSEITYNIFEAPNAKGNFYNRLEKVKNWFDKNPNVKVHIIKQIKCRNKKELDAFLEKIVLLKGEGVIIKNPNLEYINKRSANSLKVKKFYDEEGIVQKINYNNKKMKSLTIKLNNGIIFNLGNGFSDKERLNPPKVGEQITFKYYDLTKNGKPKFASFLRIRKKE